MRAHSQVTVVAAIAVAVLVSMDTSDTLVREHCNIRIVWILIVKIRKITLQQDKQNNLPLEFPTEKNLGGLL